jgi:hypothetical protein
VKKFSMFEHALKVAKSYDMDDLADVSCVSRRDFDERETFRFRAQVPCLEYVSLIIESLLLLRTNRKGRIYVGFEKLSRMEGVIDRYLRIADLSEKVYVFGEPDWKPPRHPNMKLIDPGRDVDLAREWFVITDSCTVRVAFVAVDEGRLEIPVLEKRHFSAFKSSNPNIVSQLAVAAESLIDASLAA